MTANLITVLNWSSCQISSKQQSVLISFWTSSWTWIADLKSAQEETRLEEVQLKGVQPEEKEEEKR